MTNECSHLDTYEVLSTIKRGPYCKVKSVRCPKSETIFAAKIYKNPAFEHMARTEANTLRQLSSPYIISMVAAVFTGTYSKKCGSRYPCAYILMEFCSHGDLFNILTKLPASPELIRYFFQQILESVEFCHSSGFSHLNLKLENFLVDSEFKVKLSGFSRSSATITPTHRHLQISNYSAPETLRSADFNSEAADIFSIGVIVFIMISRHPPFYSASMTDLYYKAFVDTPLEFWKIHNNKRKESVFSEQLKELVESMLRPEPQERAEIAMVKQGGWMKGEVIEIHDLRAQLDAVQQAEAKHASAQMSFRRGPRKSIESWRDCPGSMSWSMEEHKVKPKRGSIVSFSSIMSGLEPKVLFNSAKEFFSLIDSEIEESKEYYQFKWKTSIYHEFFEVKVCVYEHQPLYVLDIQLIQGSMLDLVEIVKDLKIDLFRFSN